MFIHGTSEQRLAMLQAEVQNGQDAAERNNPDHYDTKPRRAAHAWLADYLHERHGRTEKIPNPISGQDEWNLPSWCSKNYVHGVYLADPTVPEGDIL